MLIQDFFFFFTHLTRSWVVTIILFAYLSSTCVLYKMGMKTFWEGFVFYSFFGSVFLFVHPVFPGCTNGNSNQSICMYILLYLQYYESLIFPGGLYINVFVLPHFIAFQFLGYWNIKTNIIYRKSRIVELKKDLYRL